MATYHGIEVPDAPHFGPNMIKSMNEGRFEKHEVQAGLAMIKPGARILELGAGSGIVGAILARNCKPEKMVSVEANPNLIEHIGHLHSHNGLANTIEVVHGVVLSEPEPASRVDFFVKGNFLGSGLEVAKRPEKAQRISVPVIRYSDLRLAFPHDVIMMDIEGGELDFLRDADLRGVNTIILEVHRQIYGREGMNEIRQSFARAGLALKQEMSRPGVHVYTRESLEP